MYKHKDKYDSISTNTKTSANTGTSTSTGANKHKRKAKAQTQAQSESTGPQTQAQAQTQAQVQTRGEMETKLCEVLDRQVRFLFSHNNLLYLPRDLHVICFFLSGWFRQCGLIPHSKDVDFGIWIKDYNPRLVSVFQQKGLVLKHSFGKVKSIGAE